MTSIVRFDLRSFVVYDASSGLVFVADPRGRIDYVHTPDTAYRRDHRNRWFKIVQNPWPVYEPCPDPTIEGVPNAWKEIWSNTYKNLFHSSSFDANRNRTACIILKTWLESFREFHERDGEEFASLYTGIPILPPEAYASIYVQITDGCPWNRCGFCSFYRDKNFRIIPPDEVETRAQRIHAYWEGAFASRKGLFLGDANAASFPPDLVEPLIRQIHSVFSEKVSEGIQAFYDLLSGKLITREKFIRYQQLGLKRICIGVESGSKGLLRLIGKPQDPELLQDVLDVAHKAGVAVSAIFIPGLGGHEWQREHFVQSMQLIRSIVWCPEDRIYLSPLVRDLDRGYEDIEKAHGWHPLNPDELTAEVQSWRNQIRSLGLKGAYYLVNRFVY